MGRASSVSIPRLRELGRPGEREPSAAQIGSQSPEGIPGESNRDRLFAGEGSRRPQRGTPDTRNRLPTRLPESQADVENSLEAPTRASQSHTSGSRVPRAPVCSLVGDCKLKPCKYQEDDGRIVFIL